MTDLLGGQSDGRPSKTAEARRPHAPPATLGVMRMTPNEKLALAQRSYAAVSAGFDFDALVPLYHADCEWRMGHVSAAVGAERYRGHDGLREWLSVLSEGFDRFTTAIEEARVTGSGALLVRFRIDARSSGTQMELSYDDWQQLEFRDGLILTVVQLQETPPEWERATPV